MRRYFWFAFGFIVGVLVLDSIALTSMAMAQAGGTPVQEGLPAEVQVFLALINAGGFVVGVFAFIKGWIVPGYIHDQALEREITSKTELTSLRVSVDGKILPELERSRNTQDQTRKLLERLLPIIERFILHAERET